MREADGAVILRVWQDRQRKLDNRFFMRITHHANYADNDHHLGYKERNEHAERVRNGSSCFMIMCLAENTEAVPRKIKSCNTRFIFVGGEVRELDGDTWVEIAAKIPVKEALAEQ